MGKLSHDTGWLNKTRREPEDQRNKRNIKRERRGKEKTQTRKEEQKRDNQDV
jgi:hypothetical protein